MTNSRTAFLPAPLQDCEPVTVLGVPCDDVHALQKLAEDSKGLLQRADIICGSSRVLRQLSHKFELRGKLLPLTAQLEAICDLLRLLHGHGLTILVLADGDPLFFGIGATLLRWFPPQALKIIPAVSSLQCACARLRMPWTNVRSVSLHGREDTVALRAAVGSRQPVCILTGGKLGPDWIARFLLDHGIDYYEMHLFENMGSPDERHCNMTLFSASQTLYEGFPTIILNPRQDARNFTEGLDEKRFRGSYSSKKPVRGAILELMALSPDDTVWDIGAGSGILSLEISLHAKLVTAIEQNPERAFDIQTNRRTAGCINLDVVLGHAPACLTRLPAPDHIFIGGGLSGTDAGELLEYCADILPVNGRLTISCVLLRSFDICRNFFEKTGWHLEILQIQASAMEAFAGGQRLAPLNPVFLLSAHKQ